MYIHAAIPRLGIQKRLSPIAVVVSSDRVGVEAYIMSTQKLPRSYSDWIKQRERSSMCKVTCRACGRPFAVVGIVRRGENCFCSVKCLRENLGAREETQNAVSVEFFPKVQEPQPFNLPLFQHPRRVGMLAH